MSVINKVPLINEILSHLNSEELTALKQCINGQGGEPIFRSLKPTSNNPLTIADYGVKPIQLELRSLLGGMSVYEGYLVYNVLMCYVICYSGVSNQGLNILKVDTAKKEAQFVNGTLSIAELRSELDDTSEADAENRFKNVYIDNLPADIEEWVNNHFDDDDYKISLTAEELNNFIWENYYNCVVDSLGGSVTMGSITTLIEEMYYDDGSYYIDDAYSSAYGYAWMFEFSDNFIEFNEHLPFAYTFISGESGGRLARFEKDLLLIINNEYYPNIKQSIIKDLLKNKGYVVIDSDEKVDEKINAVKESIVHDDKNILDQITLTYNQGSDSTTITFPEWIIPLQLGLKINGQTQASLFWKDSCLVNIQGERVVVICDEAWEDGYTYIEIEGNVSEVLGLVYLLNDNFAEFIPNTYNMLRPKNGTQLYKHEVSFTGETALLSTDISGVLTFVSLSRSFVISPTDIQVAPGTTINITTPSDYSCVLGAITSKGGSSFSFTGLLDYGNGVGSDFYDTITVSGNMSDTVSEL